MFELHHLNFNLLLIGNYDLIEIRSWFVIHNLVFRGYFIQQLEL